MEHSRIIVVHIYEYIRKVPVKESVRVRTALVPLKVSDSKLSDYF